MGSAVSKRGENPTTSHQQQSSIKKNEEKDTEKETEIDFETSSVTTPAPVESSKALQWAAFLKKEVILPVLTSKSTVNGVKESLKSDVSEQVVDAIRGELYTSLREAMPVIQRVSIEPIRQYMNKDTNPHYGDLQWLISSNAAWWILQSWSVDSYTVPVVTSYMRQDWVFDTVSKISAENLYPWQTKVCAESILWYAMIGIRANDTSRSARQSVISALQASQRRHTKQQYNAMRK